MPGFTIERIDVIARDVCRCFAEGNRVGVVTQYAKVNNATEAALVTAIACGFMSDATRKAFVDFMTLQAMSLSPPDKEPEFKPYV